MSKTNETAQGCPGLKIAIGRRWIGVACVALAIGLALLVAGANAPKVAAQGGAVVRCEPESSWWFVDEEATVCVYVQDVVGLYGVDVELTFPGMVGIATVTDESQPPDGEDGVQMLPSATFLKKPWMIWFNTAYNNTGYAHYLVHQVTGSDARSGSGPIVCMRFQATEMGKFDIAFTRHDLSDRDGYLMANTVHSCSVEFVNPTSVELADLDVAAEGQGVHVQWRTAQESDTLGFNVYRAHTATGRKTKLNPEIIPNQVAPGSPSGAKYDWVDTGKLRLGRTYYYWVEEISISGRATLHGPVKLNMGRTMD